MNLIESKGLLVDAYNTDVVREYRELTDAKHGELLGSSENRYRLRYATARQRVGRLDIKLLRQFLDPSLQNHHYTFLQDLLQSLVPEIPEDDVSERIRALTSQDDRPYGLAGNNEERLARQEQREIKTLKYVKFLSDFLINLKDNIHGDTAFGQISSIG